MIIDAHAHYPADEAESLAVIASRDIKVMNICVDSTELGGLDAQRQWYAALHRQSPERFAWCTSFSLSGFGTSAWPAGVIRQIDQDIAAGAVAVKVWKNVGMDLRDPQTGAYVFVDDIRLDPIFRHLQSRRIPLLMHIAEPIACWSALDPANPHYGYYKNNPQWHWHSRTDVPTHERLIASRDAVIARYPDLPVVGAHFGSLEHDLSAIAHRLERFPNFFVDSAARIGDVVSHVTRDRSAVRGFFKRFVDRILWGVDIVITQRMSQMPNPQRTRSLTWANTAYDREFAFFRTGQQVNINGQSVQGMALSDDILGPFMLDNARRVYRGI